jgi:hypothetical protein
LDERRACEDGLLQTPPGHQNQIVSVLVNKTGNGDDDPSMTERVGA